MILISEKELEFYKGMPYQMLSQWVYVFKHRDEGDKEASQIVKWGLDSNPNIME